jgi:hypothetical protein
MPTARKAKKALKKILPSLEEGKVLDVGSGWGGMARLLARHYPHLPVLGYERSLLPWLWSRVHQKIFPLPNLKYQRKNFFHMEEKGCTLIYTYLAPALMQKLDEKEIETTYWISYEFQRAERKADFEVEVGNLFHSKIYLYKLTTRQ